MGDALWPHRAGGVHAEGASEYGEGCEHDLRSRRKTGQEWAAYLQDTLRGDRARGAACPLFGPEAEVLVRAQMKLANGESAPMLLFVSPEKLVNSARLGAVLRRLYELRLLSLLVADEAHTIPLWGLSFRPSMLRVRVLRECMSDIYTFPAMALTATASPEMMASIVRLLGLQRPWVERGALTRAQMQYRVLPAASARERWALITALVAEQAERE